MSEISYFSSCNCCTNPPGLGGFIFGVRYKAVRSQFTHISRTDISGYPMIFSDFEKFAEGQKVISNPPNPLQGRLVTDLSLNYSNSEYNDIEPSEGICFDTGNPEPTTSGNGGEFGGGGASGSWGVGSSNPNWDSLPDSVDRYVTGGSNYFSSGQILALATTLQSYQNSTGKQIVVVITPNNPPGSYDPFQLAEQYGIGMAGGPNDDQGIVIFLHPESKNWQVATGYGMEVEFPDITVNQIMGNAFGPNASSDLFGSLSDAIEGFTGLATEDPGGDSGNSAGYNSSSSSYFFTRIVDPQTLVFTYDAARHPLPASAPQPPTTCGTSTNPRVNGSSTVNNKSEITLTSFGGGGCGTDYFNYCGTCDPETDPRWYFCSGDGTEKIKLTQTSEETYTSSVSGCAQLYSSYPYVRYPSASTSYNLIQTSESNCCFAFTCLSQVQQHPEGKQTTTQSWTGEDSFVTPPPNVELNVTAINGIDIADVITTASEELQKVPYFPDGGEREFGEYSDQPKYDYWRSPLRTQYQIFSSPFSESGFSNRADVTMSESNWVLYTKHPPSSCYIRIWFAEVFVPDPIPEGWPMDPANEIPMGEVVREFDVEYEFPKTEKNLCFVPPKDPQAEVNWPEDLIPIITEPQILNTPKKPGSSFIIIVKYSYLKGYEPNTPYIVYDPYVRYTQGCKPDGFPAPEVPC